jgi:hypothetical protein
LTLVPLTFVMTYQVLPDTVVVGHCPDHAFPVTVPVAEIVPPLARVARIEADVDAELRRLTLQFAM